MNRRILFLVGAAVVVAVGTAVYYLLLDRSRQMTCAACEEAGGVVWFVDVDDPEICPDCAAFRACEAAYNDFRGVCPDCYGPCQECQAQYSVRESCPECYGPCQECANEYLNDFASEDERDRLCPECKACEDCQAEINRKKVNCPACLACGACKEENKRYTDIREVCPEVAACTACMEQNMPYPEACPEGRRRIGIISDTALWAQCCK